MPIQRKSKDELTLEEKLKVKAWADANDALCGYTPNPTPQRCMLSRRRYRLLGGPTRGGKTVHLCYELASAARKRHPTRTVHKNGVYLLLAPSREQLKDPWGKKLLKESELMGEWFDKPFIPEWEIEKVHYTHGAGERVPRDIILKSGHQILLAVSGDQSIDRRLKGKRLLGVCVDEDAGTPRLITEMYSRLLDANSDPDIVREAGGGWLLWGATNTEVNDAFMLFQKQCRDPDFPDHEEFVIDPAENKAIKIEERVKLLPILGEETYQVYQQGTVGAINKLLIYGKQWSDRRHMRLTDYVIQPDDNLWAAYDPGWDHNTGLCVAVINRDNPLKLRFVRCWLMKHTTIAQDMACLVQWLRGRALEGMTYDPACHKTEKGTGISLISQIRTELAKANIKVYRGLKAPFFGHDAGIKKVQMYLDPEPAKPDAEPLIEVNPSEASGCRMLREQVMKYRSFEEGQFTGQHGVVKKDDELVDLMRYLCMVHRDGRIGWVSRPPNLPLYGEDPTDPVMLKRVELTEQEMLMEHRRRQSVLAAKIRSNRRYAKSYRESRLPDDDAAVADYD